MFIGQSALLPLWLLGMGLDPTITNKDSLIPGDVRNSDDNVEGKDVFHMAAKKGIQ